MWKPCVPCALAVVAVLAAAPARGAVTWRTERESMAGRYDVEARVPSLTGTSVHRVATQALTDFSRKERAAFTEAARRETANPEDPMRPWSYHANATVSLTRPDLVSAFVTTYQYTGGAHGMTTYQGVNVGLVNGEATILLLEDLFRPGANARDLALDAVKESLRANPRAEWFQPGADPDMRGADAALIADFVITPTAITFLIEPYVAGPYAAGAFFVKVPFSTLDRELDPNGPLQGLLKP